MRTTLILGTTTLALLLLCPAGALAQDGGSAADGGFSCKRPRMLIVLDKSSSMVTGKVGSKTKWQVAVESLKTVLTTYEKSIDFGLMLFPDPSQCGWGKVKVGIGPNNASAILAQLTSPPPTAGNWTPMAQSLDVAGTVKNLQDKTYSNSVALITDGWQWCSPYDPKTRTLPVSSTATLKNLGITTYVVGFGDAVDTLTLNKMADTAGTKATPNCNPANTSSTAKDNCYYQADDATALVSALKRIALILTKEKCDNVDNDCNGKVDDGLSRACSTMCGTGTENCTAGVWGNCTAQKPETEKCDGKDNNCDGTIDEGCTCKTGDTRACGLSQGECKPGTQTCVGGIWGPCSGGVNPSAEKCDGKDNDCNTKVDDGLTRTCSTKCGSGTETCVGGKWDNCTAPQPTKEICDGKDNDCDGTADGPNTPCDNGGVCKNGICTLLGADAGSTMDTGGSNPYTPPNYTEASGCDCRVASAQSQAPLGLLLLGLALLGLTRRRRR